MVKPFSFEDSDTPKKRRVRSNKQEERLAKLSGGRTQAGSGAVWSSKGDVKQTRQTPTEDSFLLECKYTDAESFRVSTDLWAEIEHKAMIAEAGRKPAIQLEIGKKKLRLIVISEDDYLELIDREK